jgi:lactoylglutathione lyase
MSEQLRTVGAITLFVEDLARAGAFYERAFAAPVVHEDDDSAAFRFEGLIVNLLRVEAARELVAPAGVGRREAGPRFQLTVFVDDADAVCAELQERGVALLNGPLDRPWGLRTAAFADPDGHVWEVASALGDPAA